MRGEGKIQHRFFIVRYDDLLTAIYGHFDKMLNTPVSASETDGAFVFLPEAYAKAENFDEVRFEFWPVQTIRRFLEAGGQTDEGLMDLIETLERGEEFLAMIVEQEEGTQMKIVHIHRVTNLGLN